ncbi:MAG: 16S rRNA (guanine(527)-N(7))-methyltransferase RsmG [Phycisphaeraceae bacterium]|nr:16S rRNA (guanine(527)-N(7))-methyltransferase RsmG [Phycisphaeraceae bacterium]
MQPPDQAFEGALAELGVELDSGDRARLGDYLALLYRENEVMNLTRVPVEQAWMRHIFDSLTPVPWLASLAEEVGGPLKVLDVGSGGGLPGIPMAVALASIAPGSTVTLLETTAKKAAFLRRAVEALRLEGVSVDAQRAETAAHDRGRHREQHDVVVSRAVGAMPVLVELTLPFVRPGGMAIYIKGERAEAEVEEARFVIGHLGGAVAELRQTPTGTLVRLSKNARTPRTFPRLPGEPARRPLLGPGRRAPRSASSPAKAPSIERRGHAAPRAKAPRGRRPPGGRARG